MTSVRERLRSAGDRRGRTLWLAAALVVQSISAVFFVFDAFGEMSVSTLGWHHGFEVVVALALVLGVVFGALEMRHTLERSRRAEEAVSVASGAFGNVVTDTFRRWRLTPAEAEVAMLALKGFDGAEIARMRGAANGTVRAQLTRVYAKAGVSSRAQLLSLFLDDLLGGPVPGAPAAAGGTDRKPNAAPVLHVSTNIE